MKLFKNLLLAFAVLMASCSLSPASAVDFSATAGADTNFVFRGQTLSQRGISATAGVKLNAAGLYAADTAHTVSFANSNTNLLNVAEVGYETALGNVAVAGGYTYYAFTGGATGGVAASNSNFGEVFAKASTYGITAKLAQRVTQPVGGTGKDLYARLSYTSPKFAEKFSATVGTEYQKFIAAKVNQTNVDFTVNYDLTKDLVAFASYTHVGNGVNGIKLPNQTNVGVAYLF